MILNIHSTISPGVGPENKGHPGVLIRLLQLQLRRGINFFCRDKRAEGAAFINWFLNFPIHSLILLKGLVSTIKHRNVPNTGADEGLSLKRQKALKGLLKVVYDYPGAYFIRVPPLGQYRNTTVNNDPKSVLISLSQVLLPQ